MVLWSIEYAHTEGWTPHVITENVEIADYSRRCGAVVLDEPEHIAAQGAMTPVACWAGETFEKSVVMLMATGPLRRPGMIDDALALLDAGYDSALSVCRPPGRFLVDSQGRFTNVPPNPDGTMPLTNTLDQQFMLTGSLYAMKWPQLRGQAYAGFGKIGLVEQSWDEMVDVDEPEDLQRPSVVVVGNGGSLRGSRLGWMIDGYDVVVRCNWYTLDGYEADVGTRTTHWCIMCSPRTLTHFQTATVPFGTFRTDCSHLTELWLRYTGHDEPYEKALTLFQNWKHAETVQTTQFPNCSWWMEPGVTRPQQPPEKDIMRIDMATTGLLAVLKALDKWGPPVNIAGFGPRHEVVPHHYEHDGYEHPPKEHVPVIDFEAERLLLNEWEERGLVRRLDGGSLP